MHLPRSCTSTSLFLCVTRHKFCLCPNSFVSEPLALWVAQTLRIGRSLLPQPANSLVYNKGI